MQDLIVNFFYGKGSSVGVVFSKQRRLKEVPDAMIALSAAAVSIHFVFAWNLC